MTYFQESLRRAKAYLLFIPILALNESLIRNESTRIYALFPNILSFILYAIIYGSTVEEIASKAKSGWTHLLKLHALNLVLATLILYIPVFVTSYLNSEEHYFSIFAIKALSGLTIQCATLYVMPLVFIKRQVLSSFPEAFKYLAHHFLQSIWMMVLVLLVFTLKIIVSFVNVYYLETSHALLRYGIRYIHDLVSTFVYLVLFSMASLLLVNPNNVSSSTEVKQSNLA